MKQALICLLVFLISCTSQNNEDGLKGTYMASYDHEFGIIKDTLILSKANDGNGIYQIIQHTSVIKKLDGRKFPKELKTYTWLLEYNSDKQILTELKNGGIMVWNKSMNTIQFRNIKYKKIKDYSTPQKSDRQLRVILTIKTCNYGPQTKTEIQVRI